MTQTIRSLASCDAPRVLCLALAVAVVCSQLVALRTASAQSDGSTPGPIAEDAADVAAGAAGAPAVEAAPPPSTPSSARSRSTWAEPSSAEDADRPPIPASTPSADLEEVKSVKRWMVYLSLEGATLGGDFDDSTVVVRQVPGYAADFTLFPRLHPGLGFKLGVGYGALPERVGASGAWSSLSYSAVWLQGSSEQTPVAPSAALHSIEGDVRFTFRAWRHGVPYLRLSYGLGILAMNGVHGGLGEETPQLDDDSSLLVGHLVGAGVGLFFTLSDRISIDVGLAYRVLIGTSVNGAGLDDDLIGHGWLLSSGPALSF